MSITAYKVEAVGHDRTGEDYGYVNIMYRYGNKQSCPRPDQCEKIEVMWADESVYGPPAPGSKVGDFIQTWLMGSWDCGVFTHREIAQRLMDTFTGLKIKELLAGGESLPGCIGASPGRVCQARCQGAGTAVKEATPMFEEFYEMYEPEEQEVVALINRCIGGGFNWKGNFWEMTVVTLGMVFCDTGKVSTKEERLDWPVTEEERNSEKGWGRFGKEQICRLKIRRMKEELAKDLVVRPWCISEIVNTHEDCPELQAVLEEYHKPVVIQDQVLGELTLDKNYDTFEGEIQWRGKDVSLSLEVNAESKPSWTRARSAAKKLLADCETWDKAMRELAAKNLTGLANDWLSQDEENPRDPETDPITEDELARRISMTSLSVTSGGSFTAWFDCDEMFTDHAVTVYGSLKKGLKTANIEG